MTAPKMDDRFVDQVLMSAFGAMEGRRVTLLRPDGYSLPMGGDDDAFDFEEWALSRYEAAVRAFSKSPRVRQSVTDLARAVYWEAKSVEEQGRFAPLLGRALAGLRRAVGRECVEHPLPEGWLDVDDLCA